MKKENNKEQLQIAKINPIYHGFDRYVGIVKDWLLYHSGSYYWVAQAPEGKGLNLEEAQKLYDTVLYGETKLGYKVRLDGHAGAPNPAKYYGEMFEQMIAEKPEAKEEYEQIKAKKG